MFYFHFQYPGTGSTLNLHLFSMGAKNLHGKSSERKAELPVTADNKEAELGRKQLLGKNRQRVIGRVVNLGTDLKAGGLGNLTGQAGQEGKMGERPLTRF